MTRPQTVGTPTWRSTRGAPARPRSASGAARRTAARPSASARVTSTLPTPASSIAPDYALDLLGCLPFPEHDLRRLLAQLAVGVDPGESQIAEGQGGQPFERARGIQLTRSTASSNSSNSARVAAWALSSTGLADVRAGRPLDGAGPRRGEELSPEGASVNAAATARMTASPRGGFARARIVAPRPAKIPDGEQSSRAAVGCR